MPYAVNLAALTTVRVRNDFVLQLLLKSVVDLELGRLVDCDTNKAVGIGAAVPLRCDEERAAAIVALIRRRYRHDELPIYYSKTGKGGWRYVKKLPMAQERDQ